MARARSLLVLTLVGFGVVGGLGGTAAATQPACPSAFELADLAELEDFVLAAGGEIGGELTAYFEVVDENVDGLICFKRLPDATPLPTPPLLAGDNRLPKSG
jgi:hypothetical protein